MVTLRGQNQYWACDVACTHGELLKGLTCLADRTRQIILEGTTNEVAKLLADISERPALEVKSGFTSFRKPKFIAIRMIPENLDALLRVAMKHAGPEVFIHCNVITNSEVLVEAFDAGNGEVLFSPLLPIAQINDFANLMKVEMIRQKVS